MQDGERGLVSFSDTICEVYLHPISESEVAISAERLDGSKFNPEVPDDGVKADQSAVITEVLEYSRSVRDRFEAIGPHTMESQMGRQLTELISRVEGPQRRPGNDVDD
jgi:hypothetical protein